MDDLERSNHTDHHSAFHSEAGDEGNQGSLALGTLKKRKNKADQSMAVRVLLMYRKNLNLLVDESVSPSLLLHIVVLSMLDNTGSGKSVSSHAFVPHCCCTGAICTCCTVMLGLRLQEQASLP